MIDAISDALENLTKRIRNLEAMEIPNGRQNQLVNGGFEICQRTGPFVTTGLYTLDRWVAQAGGTSLFIVSQNAVTVAVGSAYSCAIQFTKGDTNFKLLQYLENIGDLQGRTLTLTIDVYAVDNNTVRVCLFDYVSSYSREYSDYHTGGSAWQSLVVGKTITEDATLIGVSIDVEATQDVYVDNGILVCGTIPPSYCPLHPYDEWGRCKRYYETSLISANLYSGGSALKIPVTFSVQKACIPTVDLSVGTPSGVIISDAVANINKERFHWQLNVSGPGEGSYTDRRYVSICNPEVVPPDVDYSVYFSPGNSPNDPLDYGYGELWKVKNGVCTFVYKFALWETVTCIFYSQINSTLYVCTWSDDTWTTVKIYKVVADVVTLVLTIDPVYNPIVDAAEFGSYIYLQFAYFYMDPEVHIRRFDPVGATTSVVYTHPDPAYSGGIAVDEVQNKLVSYDGYWTHWSTDGTSWTKESHIGGTGGLFCAVDWFGLMTYPVGGRVYLANQPWCVGPPNPTPVILRRDGDATWNVELAIDSTRNAAKSLTSLYNTSGTDQGILMLRWNWDYADPGCVADIWKKPVGGIWALEYTPPVSTDRYRGCGIQGLAHNPYDGYTYGIWTVVDTVPAPDELKGTILRKRDSLGNWTDVQSWPTYWPYTSLDVSCPMALSPNTLRKCHQV